MTKADELYEKITELESAIKAAKKAIKTNKAEMTKALNSMPYSEYLQSKHWKKTRVKALKAAKNSCQLCNAKNTTLNVHHRTYERKGRERKADLIVLCEACHAKFHDKL